MTGVQTCALPICVFVCVCVCVVLYVGQALVFCSSHVAVNYAAVFMLTLLIYTLHGWLPVFPLATAG